MSLLSLCEEGLDVLEVKQFKQKSHDFVCVVVIQSPSFTSSVTERFANIQILKTHLNNKKARQLNQEVTS